MFIPSQVGGHREVAFGVYRQPVSNFTGNRLYLRPVTPHTLAPSMRKMHMNLKAAFARMIRDKDIHKKLRVGRQTVANRRCMMGAGNYPTDVTMRKWLTKTGWRKVNEERWAKP